MTKSWLAIFADREIGKANSSHASTNSAGLVYEGLLDGRPHDKTALGVMTGWFSDTLREAQRATGEPVQYAKTVIELNHQFQIMPFLYLRPDIQYVITPNGLDSFDNAMVVGFEVGLEF